MDENFANFDFGSLSAQSILTIVRDILIFAVVGGILVFIGSKLPYGAFFPSELSMSQKKLSYFILAGLALVIAFPIFVLNRYSSERNKCPGCGGNLSKTRTEYEDFGVPDTLYNQTNTPYQKKYHYLETRYFCDACRLENKVVVVIDRNEMIE